MLYVITFYTNFSNIGEFKVNWIADKQVSRPFETSWTSSFGGVCLGQYSFGLHCHVLRSSDMMFFLPGTLFCCVYAVPRIAAIAHMDLIPYNCIY